MMDVRRSTLFTPADQPAMFETAAQSAADALLLDLEDAVPTERLPAARASLRDDAPDLAVGHRDVGVRINALDTEWWHDDLSAALDAGVDAISVPKLDSPASISTVTAALDAGASAAERPVVRLAIESPAGLTDLAAIAARAGESDAVVSLSFGLADFQRAIGAPADTDRLRELLAFDVRTAAAANGLDAYGSAYLDIDDESGLRRAAELYRSFGYAGMSAIHPGQLELINDAFTPEPARVEQARDLLAAYDAADSNSLLVDDVFLDEATVGHYRTLVDRAEAIRRFDGVD